MLFLNEFHPRIYLFGLGCNFSPFIILCGRNDDDGGDGGGGGGGGDEFFKGSAWVVHVSLLYWAFQGNNI